MSAKLPEKSENASRDLPTADAEADDALELLKPYIRPEKTQDARVVLTQVVSKSHKGPIPSAEELEHFEHVLPGAANRIVEMAEKEQNHRHGIDNIIVTKEFNLRSRGQVLALTALVLLLLAVAYLGYLGDTKSAAWLGVATIVGVVGIFISGKHIETAADNKHIAEEQNTTPKPKQKTIPNRSNKRRK